MLDHLTIRVSDLAASDRFYTTLLATLGAAPPTRHELGVELAADEPALVRFRGRDGFTFTLLSDDRPVTENVHLAFASPRPGAVEAFHAAALAAGWRDNGAPGERPEHHPGYLGAFALDPDGHDIEVVDHQRD